VRPFKRPVPPLVSVRVKGALTTPTVVVGKVNDLGEILATGVVPAPVRDTVGGFVELVELIVKVAVLVPVAEGWNLNVMVQLAPPASWPPLQVLFCVKSVAFSPENA
jgi:hypothetical protein